MKERKLMDVYIRIDGFQYHSGYRDLKTKLSDCKTILSEITEHKFVDKNASTIIEEYKDVCSFCGSEWEVETEGVFLGQPLCCSKAVEEFNKTIPRERD